jgi:hypothetical protein
MSKRRFAHGVVCGGTPNGEDMLLQFKHDDGVDTDIWIPMRAVPEVLLRIEQVCAQASQAMTAATDDVQVVVAQKVAELTTRNSLEGPSVLTITFESGLKVHVAMNAQTIDAFSGTITGLTQTQSRLAKH